MFTQVTCANRSDTQRNNSNVPSVNPHENDHCIVMLASARMTWAGPASTGLAKPATSSSSGRTTWHVSVSGKPTGLAEEGRAKLVMSTAALQCWAKGLHLATEAVGRCWGTDRGGSCASAWSARSTREESVEKFTSKGWCGWSDASGPQSAATDIGTPPSTFDTLASVLVTSASSSWRSTPGGWDASRTLEQSEDCFFLSRLFLKL